MQELQIEKEKVDGVNWFKKSFDFSFYVAYTSARTLLDIYIRTLRLLRD